MSQLQEVFNRIQKHKGEQREIKNAYRDRLANSESYQAVVEELKTLKAKKQELEAGFKLEFQSEFEKLEVLQADVESDNLLLSDLAINQLVKGEAIVVMDDKQNQYEPLFSVRFKKSAGGGAQ